MKFCMRIALPWSGRTSKVEFDIAFSACTTNLQRQMDDMYRKNSCVSSLSFIKRPPFHAGTRLSMENPGYGRPFLFKIGQLERTEKQANELCPRVLERKWKICLDTTICDKEFPRLMAASEP